MYSDDVLVSIFSNRESIIDLESVFVIDADCGKVA